MKRSVSQDSEKNVSAIKLIKDTDIQKPPPLVEELSSSDSDGEIVNDVKESDDSDEESDDSDGQHSFSGLRSLQHKHRKEESSYIKKMDQQKTNKHKQKLRTQKQKAKNYDNMMKMISKTGKKRKRNKNDSSSSSNEDDEPATKKRKLDTHKKRYMNNNKNDDKSNGLFCDHILKYLKEKCVGVNNAVKPTKIYDSLNNEEKKNNSRKETSSELVKMFNERKINRIGKPYHFKYYV